MCVLCVSVLHRVYFIAALCMCMRTFLSCVPKSSLRKEHGIGEVHENGDTKGK